MPRLDHRKSRNGCIRCKRRKVKCDEVHPSCGSCRKHGVSCEYVDATNKRTSPQHTSPTTTSPCDDDATALSDEKLRIDGWGVLTPESIPGADSQATTPGITPLEMRLFHYYLIHTHRSFTVAFEWWGVHIPLVASKHRCVLDGLLALAALHLHRNTDPGLIGERHRARENKFDSEAFLQGITSEDMLRIAVHYLHSAIRGHRAAYENWESEDFEAVWLSSVHITILTAYMLSENIEGDDSLGLDSFDEKMWLRLGIGPRELGPLWRSRTGQEISRQSGAFEGGPDLSNTNVIFNPANSKPFMALLTWALEYEVQTPEDQQLYSNMVAYVGLMYTVFTERLEPPLSTSRRIIALPSRAPPRYLDMVLLHRPRALAILAHVFAMMKLLANDIPWYTGIAEKQMPRVIDRLPPGWHPVCQWPLAILERPYDSTSPVPIPTDFG